MFKKLIDFIKGFFASAFVKRITKILIKTITQIGQTYFDSLKSYIKEVSNRPISNEEKMALVLAYAKSIGINLKESSLKMLIENILQDIKNGG